MIDRYEIVDPFVDFPDSNDDLNTDLAKLGWEAFMSLGGDSLPMHITSYRRMKADNDAEYLAQVWDVNEGSPFLRFATFPDLMDLFARWAPAIQTAAVVNLIEEVCEGGLSNHGTVEQVAARVAYGMEETLPVMRRQEAENRRHFRQRSEARKRANEAAVDTAAE